MSVSIQSNTGAILAKVRITEGQTTTGYRIPITHENILRVKQSQNVGGLENGATGQIHYRVEKQARAYEFTIPFTTEDVMVNSTIFTKLHG